VIQHGTAGKKAAYISGLVIAGSLVTAALKSSCLLTDNIKRTRNVQAGLQPVHPDWLRVEILGSEGGTENSEDAKCRLLTAD
jgi:hypothetical protein